MTSPPAFTRATVEAETDALVAWGRRNGWTLHVYFEQLTLRAATYHAQVGRLVEVRAQLDEYPGLPPAWQFVVPGTDESPASAWPTAGAQPGVSGSIFHSNLCICAPWNRLAYGEHNGPHSEWVMTSWRQLTGGMTKADSLADMLDQIHQHLTASPGMHA